MEQRTLLFLVGFSFVVRTGQGAYCNGKPSPDAQQNLNPISTGPPQLLRTVPNGKVYTVGEGEDSFKIVHIWGTPYEMGYAHGILMKEEANHFFDDIWTYLEQQIIEAINSTVHIFKPWFLEDVANLGLDEALDLEIDITRRYTGEYFFEEARGLSDATGADMMRILRIHMVGELTKGACSMFGAWGNAVLKKGSLLQLRSLDWDTDGPFKDYPQVTVYHPSDPKYGHAFANIGWTAWFGSITGYSSQRMAISEIGVSFPDDTFGRESRFGIPFTFILRDILQFDNTLDDAEKRMSSAHRTCDLILGVGDGKMKTFRGVEYSASVANFFDDTNMMPEADWHPRINNTVYWGMDWLCPGYSEVLAKQLSKHYGNLTAEITIRDVVSIIQSGNLHIAVYDFDSNLVYVANAKATYESGPQYAYDRQFVRLNMTELFMEKTPM